MQNRSRPFVPTLAAVAILFQGQPVPANAADWITNGNAAWNSDANWNPAVFPNAVDAVANFNGLNIAGNRIVTLNEGITIGSLSLGDTSGVDAYAFTIGTAGSLTFDVGAGNATLTKTAGGADNVNVPVTLNDNLVVNIGSGLNLGIEDPAGPIGGPGGIIKTGPGLLTLGGAGTNPAHTFGSLTVNGGAVMVFGSSNWGGIGNMTLNGGYLTSYWTDTFNRALGTGANQVQLTGGAGGWGINGNSGLTVRINNDAAYPVVWGAAGEGSATGFFNPGTLILNGPDAQNNAGLTWDNPIDLNGATRTIETSVSVLGGSSRALIQKVISDSQSAGAGLNKTGNGTLELNQANTFGGPFTILAGRVSATSSAALGNGGATNALVFSGGTLRALGAIASPATRPVTLTSTAIIDSNGFPVSFAGTLAGAGGLTKDGPGTLTLSGANSYAGPTVVNAGALQFANTTALYNGAPANWTAGNLNFKAGTTLAVNVDSAGVAGLTEADLGALLANALSAGASTSGLQSGAAIALDTSTAAGGTFTPSSIFTDSTGAFGGRLSLTKQGAGTLVLNQANTYSGATTISAGTLQLDPGGTMSPAPLHLNGGTLAVNQTVTVTQGAGIPALIGGSGSLANTGAGTLVLNAPTYHTGTTTAAAGSITLAHARALQHSALDTTGTGTVSLSGMTSATFGGLSNSGAPRDIAAVIDAGYAAVTGITLNPQSGLTHTYAGAITDGAAGMTLTLAGPGAQILTGTNTFTGATLLNQGTLQAGANSTVGRISGTSGFVFNGGTLLLHRSSNANIDALADTAPITSNGGTLAVRSQDAGGVNATENIGAATVNRGQMNFNWLNSASSGSRVILAGLTLNSSLTATAQTAAVTFSGALANNGRWGVTGAGTSNPGDIIGPWATTGAQNGAGAQTDYAVYNADFVAPAGIAASAEDTWAAGANATLNGASTLTGARTLNSLRYTGNAQTLNLDANNLETHGLLNGGSGVLTVSGSGAVTTPAGGGNLFLSPGNHDLTLNAPVNDHGGPVTLVKSGTRTLTLGATANGYSGGTVINAGTLAVRSDEHLGATGTDIVFDGSATLHAHHATTNGGLVDLGSRPITLNHGAIATLSGVSRPNVKIGGAVSGSGGVILTHGTFWGKVELASTANTFSGPLTIISTGDDGNSIFRVNSLADGAGHGDITLLNSSADGDLIGLDYGSGGANGAGGGGAVAPLVLNHRRIVVGTNGNNVLNNSSDQAVTIHTDIGFSGTGNRAMRFGVQARAGSGINTLAGRLTDNFGGVFTPTFGGGTWVLSGANTHTGKTTVNAGVLSFDSIQDAGSNTANALGIPLDTASVIDLAANATLRYTGSGHSSDRVIHLTGTGNGTCRLDAAGSGTLALTGGITSAGAGNTTSTLRLEGTGNGEIGLIRNGANVTALRKSGPGTWTLTAANTHTGATTVEAGKLVANGDQTAATGALTVEAAATLGGHGTLGGNVTVSVNGQLEFLLSTPAASHNGLEVVTGKTFAFAGDSILNITSTGGAAPGLYTLVSAPGGITGAAPTALNLPSGWTATVSIVDGKDLVLDVTATGGAGNYGDWQAANGTAQPVDGDHDGDGVANGIEWFVRGPNASSGVDTSPGVFSNAGGLTVAWTKHPDFNGTFAVESADAPQGPWSPETVGDRVAIVGNEIRFTFATPLPNRKYARLKVYAP